MKKNVAIIIVNYNGLKYLPACLGSVFNTTDDGVSKQVYLVDNFSQDGSVQWIEENYPQVNIIRAESNLGFAGGNNLAWQYLEKVNLPEYILLLNQDAQLTAGCLTTLVQYMDTHPQTATCQPKLLLWPETQKINSLGNVIHYLGFGYSDGNEITDQGISNQPSPVNYCTGAAVLIRSEVIKKIGGLFDDFMFMYLEDLDLGWRTRLAGYFNYLVPTSVMYHQYEFKRGMKQIYYFERNRLWIILKNYRLPTLILLLPAILLMELGQIFFACLHRTIKYKLAGYAWFLSLTNWQKLIIQRRLMRQIRRISDRQLISEFSGRIDFQPIDNWLLKYIANPIFACYRVLIKLLIVW